MTNGFVASRALPDAKDVVNFLKPHLDTLQVTGQHPSKPELLLCSLEGKPRPMLVLRRFPNKARGRCWFLVLPITSKEEGTVGDLQPIGSCLDEGVDSFVEMTPCELPDNLISRTSSGHLQPIRRPCDPESFANAIKVLMFKSLKSRG